MDYGVAVCTSITAAQRIKRLADSRITGVSIMQIPSSLQIKGCNYSVRFKLTDLNIIQTIFNDSGLTIKAMFKESSENGKKVYTRL